MSSKDCVEIPVVGPVSGSVVVPGSKSITNRALVAAALAEGETLLLRPLDSVDTRVMLDCLRQTGTVWRRDDENLRIRGLNAKPLPCDSRLYVENSGTTARFLIPFLALGQGSYLIDGNERMRTRPIAPLLRAMNSAGFETTEVNGTGALPVRIQAGGFPGGDVEIDGETSSQFISALMLSAPYATEPLTIRIVGEAVSRDYLEMTRRVMADFGAETEWLDGKSLRVSNRRRYRARSYPIEADMSSASYFFAVAAITGGKVRVGPVSRDSIQGDLKLVRILESMGCSVVFDEDSVTLEGAPLKATEADMNTISDVAPTLAAVALFAQGKTVVRNVANMRLKECDRIAAVVKEFRKLGARVEEFEDGFAVTGGVPLRGAALETYDDHRMAMSFSLAGLKVPGVRILDPGCVSKTFPDYFERLFRLIGESRRIP